MKIMFLSAIDANVYGGLEALYCLAAEGLAQRGHDVTIVSRPGSELLRRAPETGVRTLAIPFADDFNLLTISRLKKLFKQLKTDLVVCNRNKDLRLGGLAARWQGHTKVLWWLGVNLTKHKLIHRLLTPRLCDGIVAPSQDLKDDVIKCGYIGSDMVSVIPNGIKENVSPINREKARQQVREKYRFPQEGKIALTIGRLVDEKGLPVLIEAAAMIIKQNAAVRFLVVGEGELRSELEKAINRHNLRDAFVLAGYLDDYALEVAGADILLHPSLAESFGMVLLDAMAARLPIVATTAGGIPEVFGSSKAARLIPPGDDQALAQATLELLGSEEECVRMGEAGRREFELKFTAERFTDRLERYMANLVGKE